MRPGSGAKSRGGACEQPMARSAAPMEMPSRRIATSPEKSPPEYLRPEHSSCKSHAPGPRNKSRPARIRRGAGLRFAMKARGKTPLPPDLLVRLTRCRASPRGGAPMLNLKPARILPMMVGGLVLFGCDVQRSAGPNDLPPPTSLAEFTMRVQHALAAGRHPAIEARRPAPGTPQAPGDGSFTAAVVRLDDAADRPSIEINVTSANVLANASPPPDAWLQVLGQKIELRVSDGTTRIKQETPETDGELRFGGIVASVDVSGNKVTLADGTILRFVAGSEIERGDDQDDSTLATLADVQHALAAGDSVVARGEGLLETATPRTLDVISVRFRLKEREEPEQQGVAFAHSPLCSLACRYTSEADDRQTRG